MSSQPPPTAPDAPRFANSSATLTVIARGLRRAVGLHGDAVRNAEQAVRRDDHARRNRNYVAEQVRTINDAYPTETDATETHQLAP